MKTPAKRQNTSTPAEIEAFSKQISALQASTDGRLLFVLDATASRQPTWDLATGLQHEMFSALAHGTELQIRLGFYRGYREFKLGPWVSQAEPLHRLMRKVYCEAGRTQIIRVLHKALDEHQKTPLSALVFIGDSVEESPAELEGLAGQMRLRGLPGFFFYEGDDFGATATFKNLARLSGGAAARFDPSAPDTLLGLLKAAARYATGGVDALRALPSTPKALLEQLDK